MQIISNKITLLGLFLFLNILSSFTQVSSVSAATGSWNSIIQQANFDPNDDQQAVADTDLVGNAVDAMLEAQNINYTFSTGTAQDDVYFFRVRLGNQHTNGKLGTSFYLALDLDTDLITNVFVEANIPGT
jgi:sensor domain CHASE-containing protein